MGKWQSEVLIIIKVRDPGIIPARSQYSRLQGPLRRRNTHSLLSLEELALVRISFSPCCNLLL